MGTLLLSDNSEFKELELDTLTYACFGKGKNILKIKNFTAGKIIRGKFFRGKKCRFSKKKEKKKVLKIYLHCTLFSVHTIQYILYSLII